MVVVKQPASPDYGPAVDVGETVVTPANNARAGIPHQNVRTVMLVSILGVVVAFGIAYLLFFT